MLALLTVSVCALAGCVSISEESARQLDEIGDVELTTVVCASETVVGPRCPASNTSEVGAGGEYQVLIGYRLPPQTSPPETVFSTEPPVALARSESYSAELNRLAPPPAESGQRWVGYLSPPFGHQLGDSQSAASVIARVLLLRSPDGGPFPAPFRYRTVVGYRHATEDPNRAVSCGDSLVYGNGDTVCVTYPDEETIKTDLQVQTRDLGIVAGPSTRIARGSTGSLPFTLAYNGATASPAFALAATTTLPGGTVTPATLQAAPAESGASVVPVTVSVPASTPPGSYEVTLTATHGSGHVRRGSGLVTVTGAGPVDRAPPELAVRMRTRPRIARARRIGVVADVSCSEPCRLTTQMRAGRTLVGTVRERRFASGRRNVRIRFQRGLGREVLGARRLSLRLSVTARDRAGNARRRSIRFSLRR